MQITVSGLPPAGLVTLQAQAHDGQGRLWESTAQFRASQAGTLNLATAVPVSGSYHAADAAGPLWSLRPAFTSDPDTQFRFTGSAFTVRLQLLVNGQARASATLARLWSLKTAPTVQTVSRDGFASTLFTPTRPGQVPRP
ncbi:MAG: acyl-CoA thioesterase/BAAT N-terminal domain-containing protein [Streptosporangiaceae bacterium]|nr:acyl-CoA thioesterase/BAAT N-terminal domain-containing protein [Streptosporangiaceae bacterium]